MTNDKYHEENILITKFEHFEIFSWNSIKNKFSQNALYIFYTVKVADMKLTYTSYEPLSEHWRNNAGVISRTTFSNSHLYIKRILQY